MPTKKLFQLARKILLGLIFIFITNLPAYSATHYVSTDGSSTWEQSTNISTPCSATTAMSNASAGDTVYFRGGTYEVGQSVYGGQNPVWRPSNSGTSENPIVFSAYSGETPVINATTGEDNDNSNCIGSVGKDYITWDGFTVQADNGVKMGSIYFYDTEGCILRNCTVNGGSTLIETNDNRETLRIDYSNDITVQYCIFYNARADDDYKDIGAIKMYDDTGVIIENCEMYDNTHGVYAKRRVNNLTVRYNFIHDNKLAFRGNIYQIASEPRNSDTIKIYHNVFANNSFSGIAWDIGDVEGTDPHSNDCEFYNNTIYNSVRGISYTQNQSGHGHVVYNNIIVDNSSIELNGTFSADLDECDHNQFGTDSLTIRMRLYGTNTQTYTSLASWQSSGELVGGGNPGSGSLVSDPKFVNTSGSLDELADFALAGDSPCKGAGRSGVDMGADISLVGLQGGQQAKAPSAPKNLRAE
jgi:hypothetical protein